MESYDFDLYEALDLGPDAHETEIRRAYRQLALVHHPDRTGGSQSSRFLQIKTAYDVLIDRDKRTNYDAFHSDRRFARDRRPLTAKEAAWLVDAQKRAWGVREVHPFAVCILCDSCPCPADGVCYACGMHFCQMCVRKMHCRDGVVPHYPVRQSSDFRKKLEEQGREQDKERKLLRGATSNQWLMRDEDFRHQRDLYRDRCRRGAAERCQYYAWGQTKYTVRLALWPACGPTHPGRSPTCLRCCPAHLSPHASLLLPCVSMLLPCVPRLLLYPAYLRCTSPSGWRPRTARQM